MHRKRTKVTFFGFLNLGVAWGGLLGFPLFMVYGLKFAYRCHSLTEAYVIAFCWLIGPMVAGLFLGMLADLFLVKTDQNKRLLVKLWRVWAGLFSVSVMIAYLLPDIFLPDVF